MGEMLRVDCIQGKRFKWLLIVARAEDILLMEVSAHSELVESCGDR